MLGPTLTTDRLILRPPTPQDAQSFITFYQSDRARFVGGPMQPRQAWCFFGTEMGHWLMRGFGMFIVTWKGAETALGLIGHWYPEGWPETEVGWVLFNQEDEGKGIAIEAAAACVHHAWSNLNWTSVVSYVDPENTASKGVAERLGAVVDPEAQQPKPDHPCLVYRHQRPQT